MRQYKISELMVLKSNAGYYIGTIIIYPDNSYEPYSRESEYFKTKEEALKALSDNDFFYDGSSSKKSILKPHIK